MAATDFLEFDPDTEIQHLCDENYDNYFACSHLYQLNINVDSCILPDTEDQYNEVHHDFDFLQDQDKQLLMSLEHETDRKNQEAIFLEHQEEEPYWRNDLNNIDNVDIQREITVLPQGDENEPDYLDPEAFLDFTQPSEMTWNTFQDNLSPQIREEAQAKFEVHSPVISLVDSASTREDDLNSVDDLKLGDAMKKGSTKQDGTLAFLRQCILEIKAGMDIIFSPQEDMLKQALWNYINKVSRKTEIQKQPKKKIKYLIIACLDKENAFEGLDVEASNIIRKKCYWYIRNKVESRQFESNFLKHRNYGKVDKKGKERSQFDAENKILNTLHQYFEEIKKPSKFRGLYSDSLYTPDLDWIRKIESKERRNQDDSMLIESNDSVTKGSNPYKKKNI